MEKAKVEQDGGLPLWMRAIVQPWTGSRLKVTLGLFPCKDIRKVQDSSHPRFPFIGYNVFFTPFLPGQPEGYKITLPFIPYILTQAKEGEEEVEMPEWINLVTACNGMFRATTAPHQKGNASTLADALKSEWRKEKMSKYIFPEMTENRTTQMGKTTTPWFCYGPPSLVTA